MLGLPIIVDPHPRNPFSNQLFHIYSFLGSKCRHNSALDSTVPRVCRALPRHSFGTFCATAPAPDIPPGLPERQGQNQTHQQPRLFRATEWARLQLAIFWCHMCVHRLFPYLRPTTGLNCGSSGSLPTSPTGSDQPMPLGCFPHSPRSSSGASWCPMRPLRAASHAAALLGSSPALRV